MNRIPSNPNPGGSPNSARIDAAGMAQPSPNFSAALHRASAIAHEVAVDQMGGWSPDAGAEARRNAAINISEFYRMRRDPKPNSAYLDPAGFRHATPRDEAALRRQNSFLSISDTFGDIRALAFHPGGGLEPYLSTETADVLDQSILTVNLLSKALQEAAIARAVAGERALPLSLDRPRLDAFLADHEATLERIVSACAGGVVEPDELIGPLHTFVTDYLRYNRLLPSGLGPRVHEEYRGLPLCNAPVNVIVGRFPDSECMVQFDHDTSRDALVFSLGSVPISGPMEPFDSVIPGFDTKPPAQKRAAIILQSLFQTLTSGEERLHAQGTHARTVEERQKAQGTQQELDYPGSLALHDSTQPDARGMSQRLRATMPLRVLAQHQIEGSSNITNRDLATWLGSAQFNMDMGVIADPSRRLGMAQVGTTASALLRSRAFGGQGLQ